MRNSFLLLLLAVFGLLVPLPGRAERKADAAADQAGEKLSGLIDDLASDQFVVRERAYFPIAVTRSRIAMSSGMTRPTASIVAGESAGETPPIASCMMR